MRHTTINFSIISWMISSLTSLSLSPSPLYPFSLSSPLTPISLLSLSSHSLPFFTLPSFLPLLPFTHIHVLIFLFINHFKLNSFDSKLMDNAAVAILRVYYSYLSINLSNIHQSIYLPILLSTDLSI